MADLPNNSQDGLQEGETLDDLRLGGLKIIQRQDGYRFSLDPVLLCAFARVAAEETVVDLGSGSGVIPLLLARRSQAARIIGVERQSAMADRSRRSVQLNGLEGRITILEGDLRQIRTLLNPESAQVVVANPPFRKADSGRLSPRSERAQARHEVAGDLVDFVTAAAYLLGTGGRCYLVYLAERLAELLDLLRHVGLEPKRLRCIHSQTGQAARMVLVESRRGGGVGLTVEAPLYVYAGEHYSAEVLSCYGEG
jgi:tRNA1Val (adenine37-N6)-methyltransferase